MTTRSFFARPPAALRAGMLAVAAAFPVTTLAVPAARVEFVVGDAVAVSKATGQTRSLTKGAPVENGDRIFTNKGRVQLRFTDQAYVSLQPQSEFAIDDYQFNGKTDGTERGFFSLLKGGLRTITGLVGRTNRKNYQVTTTVATIGIRGTEYTIAYTNSVTGTVGGGELNVCNGVGCVPFGTGQSFLVTDQNTRPVLTSQKTDLPPQQPTQPTPSFISGDQTGSDGLPNIFIFAGMQTLSVAQAQEGGGVSSQPATPVVFDGQGVVQQIGVSPIYNVAMAGNNGVLAWGTGLLSPTAAPRTHFVAGLQTPAADLSALQATTTTLTYTQFDGTAVTGAIGSTRVTGDVPAMSLTLRTGAGFLKADISATGSFSRPIAGGTESFSYLAKTTDIAINATGVGQTFSTAGVVCMMSGSPSCSASFALLFAGRNASSAGAVMAVSGNIPASGGSVLIAGAAVFTKD